MKKSVVFVMERELITNLKKLNIDIKDGNNQIKPIELILLELSDILERLNKEADEISKEISKLKKERWY